MLIFCVDAPSVLFSSRNDGSITPTAGSAEVVPICSLELNVPIEAAVWILCAAESSAFESLNGSAIRPEMNDEHHHHFARERAHPPRQGCQTVQNEAAPRDG